MYIQLYQIKQHLNIDEDFHDDDEYLVSLEQVAENVVEKHIDDSLSEIAEDNNELPSGLCHAMLLFIGNMYNNRESVSSVSNSEIPNSYTYLLDLFKNYSLRTTGGANKIS